MVPDIVKEHIALILNDFVVHKIKFLVDIEFSCCAEEKD
jgi:hypothetical protein